MIHVEIDMQSGFCFGVVRAIDMAEAQLKNNLNLSSLGQMVHNAEEVSRLENLGMKTISVSDLEKDSNDCVLVRAHGEPPETYAEISRLGKTLVDATCPIVLRLQKQVKNCYLEHPEAQIVIYGKPGHAEVIGLLGQTEGNAIVITHKEDISQLNVNAPVYMFSQTTMPLDGFAKIRKLIESHVNKPVEVFDTICRKVSNRVPLIHEFAQNYDVCIFVAGKNSSNGQMLFNVAKKANPNTYFVSTLSDIDVNWFVDEISVGICGATSTPMWQMKNVRDFIEQLYVNK